MTLRKGHPLPLHKPSTMRSVLSCVEQGHSYRRDIIKVTGLHEGQVRSALHNLVFIGLLARQQDAEGRSVYVIPGQWYGGTPACFRGVTSVFHARFTYPNNMGNEHP